MVADQYVAGVIVVIAVSDLGAKAVYGYEKWDAHGGN